VGAPVDNNPSLEIIVDAMVRLPVEHTPKRVIEALRRVLRQHEADRASKNDLAQRERLALIQQRDGHYCLPQALLRTVSQACQRHGITPSLIDRRISAPCPRLRSHAELSGPQQRALRKLLIREQGVLVAESALDRMSVATELIARRQQRTLVLTGTNDNQLLRSRLRQRLGLAPDETSTLNTEDRSQSRVVVGSYDQIDLDQPDIAESFGLIVCDGLSEVSANTLMQAISHARARYLLGLAEDAARADGLHGPLYLALGGVIQQLSTPAPPHRLRLHCRQRSTAFDFPYEGRSDYQALLAQLSRDAARNQLIINDVCDQSKQEHACVLLSERRDHLEQLQALLSPEVGRVAATITSAVRPVDRSAIVDRFNKGALQLLLATGQIATESLSIHRATRLFIAFPFSYGRKLERIVQALMRPSANKTNVVVYDYDDVHVAPLHRAHQQRAKTLARLQRASEQQYLQWAQMELSFGGDE